MLIRLGRWLRAAGYDTVIIEEPLSDQEVFLLAKREERLLITRDRLFLSMREGDGVVVWLESNDVDACAEELKRKLGIDWLKNPFSRCILCNSPLEEARGEELDKVPEDVLEYTTEYTKCPRCQKVFWLGSHTDRMLRKLQRWAS
jgi:uncharacterized protein with PIN domain